MRSLALLAALLAALLSGPAVADSVVAARTIRAQEILTLEDLALSPAVVPGALGNPEEAIGLEARVSIYAGRAIRAGDLGPPARIDRNAIVVLRYAAGSLSITAEGRALDRGATGDRLRVMNLASRTIVTGTVAEDGAVHVSDLQP